MKVLKLLLLFTIAISSNLYSQEIWNKEYEHAYDEVLKLNFSKSDSILLGVDNKIEATEAYIKSSNYFFNVMLNNYSNEVLKNDSISFYLDIVNSSGLKSPWISYFQIEMLTMKSLISIRLDNKMSSAYSTFKASKLAKSAIKKYPDFAPIKTLYGLQLCTFSQIPDNFKSIASFFGIEGNYNDGIKNITNSLKNIDDGVIKDKSIFIEVFSKKEFGKVDNVRISSSIENYKSYPVMIYYEAYLLYKDNNIEAAKDLLIENEQVWQNKMNYLNYFTGKLLAFSLNYKAEKYLKTFLKNTKTDSFKQSSYRYLAYLELLRNSQYQYKKYVNLITSYKYDSQSESDKSAVNEVTYIIQPALIKAQLLFDGGLYNKAKETLLNQPKSEICNTDSDLIIYYYRLGSIYLKLNEANNAIENFEKCTSYKFNNKFHYQANAYLHLGELYRDLGNNEEAEKNLEKCLDLNDFPYSYSIHTKAKKILDEL